MSSNLSKDYRSYADSPYKKIKRLGRGTHGSVFLGVDRRNNGHVAIKVVKRKDKRLDQQRQLARQSQFQQCKRRSPSNVSVVNNLTANEFKIKREIAIMRRLDHPNIVRLLDVVDDPLEKNIYIVLEHMAGGEVHWRTPENRPVQTVAQSIRILRDVMLGLDYLHGLGIVHRDIKPANLLWSLDRTIVKISDFGISLYALVPRAGSNIPDDTELTDLMTDDFLNRLAGTPAFLAPELNLFGASTSSSTDESNEPKYAIDVWALGVTLYCLLFGRVPWNESNEWKLYKSIAETDFTIPPTMGSDDLPTGGKDASNIQAYPDGTQALFLLNGLLQKSPSKRMTIIQLKQNPYVTKDIPQVRSWQRETSRQANKETPKSAPLITEEDKINAVSHARWRTRLERRVLGIKTKLSRKSSAALSAVDDSIHSRPLTQQSSTRGLRISEKYAIPLPSLSNSAAHRNEKRSTTRNDSDSKPSSIPTASPRLSPSNLSRNPSGFGNKIKTFFSRPPLPSAPAAPSGNTSRLRNLVSRRSADPWPSEDMIAHPTAMTEHSFYNEVDPSPDLRVFSEPELPPSDDEGWSSDDYGETEGERIQRELVGAGGVTPSNLAGQSAGSSQEVLNGFEPNGAAIPTSLPIDRRRAATPLSHLSISHFADAESGDVGFGSSESDSEDSDRQRHTVYSSSSSSENGDTPVEVRPSRLRRQVIQ